MGCSAVGKTDDRRGERQNQARDRARPERLVRRARDDAVPIVPQPFFIKIDTFICF